MVADGGQIVVGLDSDAAVCLRFSPDGAFLGAETRPLADAGIDEIDLDAATQHPVPTIADLNPRGCELVAGWAAELVAAERPVHLGAFDFPERNIALLPLPAAYEEFLESPWEYDEEERSGLAVKISRWRELDRFVFRWHGEHWCASDGRVHS